MEIFPLPGCRDAWLKHSMPPMKLTRLLATLLLFASLGSALACAMPVQGSPTAPDCGDGIVFVQGDLVSVGSIAGATKVVDLIEGLRAECPGTPVRILSTGDNEQEGNPRLADYQAYFGTTYGPYYWDEHIFKMVRGNHDSWGDYFTYFGTETPLNLSFDFAGWHFIGLDQLLENSVDSNSLNFFQTDLQQHPSACTLAYWHAPRFSSGPLHGDAPALAGLFNLAYTASVDVVVNGHDHNYQRFLPINSEGVQANNGVAAFIVGIGGQAGRLGSKLSQAQGASALYLDKFPGGPAIGTLRLALHPDFLEFALYNANDPDAEPLDSGTIGCHTHTTNVQQADLEAWPEGGGIHFRWTTWDETLLVASRIRGVTGWIPAQYPGEMAGSSYDYLLKPATCGIFQIELQERGGNQFVGSTVSACPGYRSFLPFAGVD